MEPKELENQVAGLGALSDPVRRSLYFYVAHRPREVSRDQAAQGVGVSRALAGFHLDRLASEGLLETSFRRLSGRVGPGAGRPAKLYRRSGRQLTVSMPQREYELAARILAATVDESGPEPRDALAKQANLTGKRIGADAQAGVEPRAGRKRLLAVALETLGAHGYEPEQMPGEIRLLNCPFHGLVTQHKELVCGMSLALIEGVVEGLDLRGAKAVLDPMPERCCVAIKLTGRDASPPQGRSRSRSKLTGPPASKN